MSLATLTRMVIAIRHLATFRVSISITPTIPQVTLTTKDIATLASERRRDRIMITAVTDPEISITMGTATEVLRRSVDGCYATPSYCAGRAKGLLSACAA